MAIGPRLHAAFANLRPRAPVKVNTFPLMTTISKSNKLVTLINVFTGAPAHQQELLDLLARATETSVRHAPGFYFC